MKPRRAAAAAALATLTVVAACLEALPEPVECAPPSRIVGDACVACESPRIFVGDECTVCPPDAVVPNEDCGPAFGTPPHGCIGQGGDTSRFSCFAGEAADCTCDPEDCPEALVCYSDGQCPAKVLAAAPDARCVPLRGDRWRVYENQPLEDACTCRCLACANRCDGSGPIFGVYDDGAGVEPYFFPAIDLEGLAPPAGKMGVYVRVRGWSIYDGNVSPIAIGVADFDSHALSAVASSVYQIVGSGEFGEFVAWSSKENATPLPVDAMGTPSEAPTTWAEGEPPPMEIVLAIMTQNGDTAPYGLLVEVDCVIPFFVE